MSSSVSVTVNKKGALVLLALIVIITATSVYFVNVRASEPYHNCLQIYEATGKFAIPASSALYNPALDRNHNGIACEEKP